MFDSFFDYLMPKRPSYPNRGRASRSSYRSTSILIGLAVLFTLVMVLIPAGGILGQETVTLQSGRAVIGVIDATHPSMTYSFDANAGDLVVLSAYGVTPETDPDLTLFGPNQQQLAYNDRFLSFSTVAGLVYRVQDSGNHVVRVGGTPGEFLLELNVLTTTPATQLEIDTPVEISLSADEPARVFSFNTDPLQSVSVMVAIPQPTADVEIDIRSATGESVVILRNNPETACFSFGQGDELYELSVTSAPKSAGTMTIILSNASCEFGEPSVPTTAEVQFTPVAIENVCAASSPSNVNIRSGDGVDFSSLALLPAQQPIEVIGQNEEGSWYAVQNEALSGWIAASVVFVTGPCDGLPVTPVMDEPMLEATPEMTEEPEATPEMTEEPTPEMTEEPTPEVTEEPTPEVTEQP